MMRNDVRFDGRIVIVGASLAGQRAAETLREEGFEGPLTLIGDEPYPPYDRPPLSKSVLTGWLPATDTFLPQGQDIHAQWLLGVPATHLDVANKTVQLADDRHVPFDRLLIATGTRARPWPDASQAALDGVFTIRTLDDGARLHQRLAAKPHHVLVIGAGFTGSEVASICREGGLDVTVTERSAAPLAGALGGAVGTMAAHLQRAYGVDLRCNVTVMALEGDAQGRLRCAHLSDGDTLEVDVAVVALGAVRNVEWLQDSGLAADARGVVCDGSCRVVDANSIVTDDIFVAGDVARWPHPLFDGQFLAVDHWGNAVAQAATAAHNMICGVSERRAYGHIPNFWSNQFGLNIKSVGLPMLADEVVVMQGSVSERRLVAAYGHKGRMVAALAVNMPRGLDAYEALIAQKSVFPPPLNAPDRPTPLHVVASGFPSHELPTYSPEATTTGPGPGSPPEESDAAAVQASDPRVPSGPLPL